MKSIEIAAKDRLSARREPPAAAAAALFRIELFDVSTILQKITKRRRWRRRGERGGEEEEEADYY